MAQTMAEVAHRMLKEKYPDVQDIEIEPDKEPGDKARGSGSGIM